MECGARCSSGHSCSVYCRCPDCSCRGGPRRGHLPSASLLLLAAALLYPLGAHAQLKESVYAAGQYQYDTNVFDLQRGFQNLYGLSDYYYAYGAGLVLNEQISQQNLYLRGSDTEYAYHRFSQLTHNEYNVNGGWLWKIGQDVNGSIDVLRTRTMVPFTEVISVVMSLETDQRENASVGFLFTPEWRIDLNGYRDEVREPLPAQGEPNLKFNDTGGGALISFLGAGEWVANANVTYQHGGFEGAAPAAPIPRLPHTFFLPSLDVGTGIPLPGTPTGFFGPAYNQWAESVGTTYSPAGQGAGVSTFDLAIGHTQRTSPFGVNNESGVTGHLDYNRQLTGKTSVSLALDRDVLTYIAAAGGVISNSGALNGLWKATYKTSFSVGYDLVYVQLPEQGPVGTMRHDRLQFATFAIDYRAAPWLAIRPYANYQTRTSNLYGANFNASIFGVSVLIEWPQVTGAAPQPVATVGVAY